MLRFARIAFVTLLVWICPVEEVFAQWPAYPLVPERPSIGVSVGASLCADPEGGGTSLDIAFTSEVPTPSGARVRTDVGVTSCLLSRNFDSRPPTFERATVARASVAAVISKVRPSQAYPIGMYYGFGAGFYRYALPHSNTSSLTAGVHGLGGMEYVFGDALVWSADLKFTVFGGPNDGPVNQFFRVGVSATSALRFRF